jgi:hypothetical protein
VAHGCGGEAFVTTWCELAEGRPRHEWDALARDAILAGVLSPAEAACALLDTFTPEPPPLTRMPLDTWADLYALGLGGTFAVGARLDEGARPQAPLRLYRTAEPVADGLSWTPYRGYAATYGWRDGRHRTATWQCDVPPERMLAAYDWGPTYQEIVADVRGLPVRHVRAAELLTREALDADRAALAAVVPAYRLQRVSSRFSA